MFNKKYNKKLFFLWLEQLFKNDLWPIPFENYIYKKKTHQVSQVRLRPKLVTIRIILKRKILNEYFSVSTWKLAELKHIILRILVDDYKFTWLGTLRQIHIF